MQTTLYSILSGSHDAAPLQHGRTVAMVLSEGQAVSWRPATPPSVENGGATLHTHLATIVPPVVVMEKSAAQAPEAVLAMSTVAEPEAFSAAALHNPHVGALAPALLRHCPVVPCTVEAYPSEAP